jgi:hypothetical protein
MKRVVTVRWDRLPFPLEVHRADCRDLRRENHIAPLPDAPDDLAEAVREAVYPGDREVRVARYIRVMPCATR